MTTELVRTSCSRCDYPLIDCDGVGYHPSHALPDHLQHNGGWPKPRRPRPISVRSGRPMRTGRR